jgi:hypothetical protein
MAFSSLLEIYPEAIHDIDREGQTLLHRSLGNVTDKYILTYIIHTLLAAKQDLTEMADDSGMIALHYASGLGCYCEYGDSQGEVVELLLLHTPQWLWSAQDNKGRTALHFNFLNDKVVLALVTACPELVQIQDNENKKPMDYYYTDEELDLRIYDIEVYEVARALFVARPYGHVTNNGELILHAALYTNGCPLVIVAIFMHHQPHLTSIVDGNGNLPIHIACRLRTIPACDADYYIDVVEELCMCFPQGPRMLDSQGKLPLTLMIEAEQPRKAIQIVLAAHPAAIVDQGLGSFETCMLLSKIDNDVRYRLFRDVPFLLDQYRNKLG